MTQIPISTITLGRVEYMKYRYRFAWRNKCSGYSRACCGLRAGPRAGPREKFSITAGRGPGCGLDLLK